jgi:hypothetical protein
MAAVNTIALLLLMLPLKAAAKRASVEKMANARRVNLAKEKSVARKEKRVPLAEVQKLKMEKAAAAKNPK